MFFKYNLFQDGNAIDTNAYNFVVNSLRISNGIFDHMNLLNILAEFDTDKPVGSSAWTDDTVLNVTFDNTLDGGTISEFIGNIDYLAIQRCESGTQDWITLHKIYKTVTPTSQSIVTEFTMKDTYTQNGVQYSYRIVPVDVNGNVGTAFSQDVVSIFNDAYIADASHIYKITYEYGKTNTRNQKAAIYEPYGSQKPFVAYNADINYDSGNITAILMAPTSEANTTSYLDRMAQKKLVDEFNSWLSNGRAKILKDFNGELKIVTVVNNISNSYYQQLGNGLASTSFDIVEVGDMTQEDLDKLGMTNFPIHDRPSMGG